MRLILIIFFAYFISLEALFAATISRSNVGSSYVFGGETYSVYPKIEIEGEIVAGDYEKFMALLSDISDESGFFHRPIDQDILKKIRRNPSFREITFKVQLSSDGGDVIEAIKIGRAIERFRLVTLIHDNCFSACFFIYVAGVERKNYTISTVLGNILGVHRPFFEQSYFSQLISSQAKKQHEDMVEITKNYLREMFVAEELIELIYRTPPSEMHLLKDEEVEKWIGEYQPFFEDWLEAQCSHVEKPTPAELDDFSKIWHSDFSEGYKNYLDRKVRAHNICKNEIIQEEQLRIFSLQQ